MGEPGRRYAVVVTGTSSGIGKAISRYLIDKGIMVFAGVRNERDADEIRSLERPEIVPLFLDVTNREAIAVASTVVEETVGSSGLQGLVNNAGITCPGPIEYVDMASVRKSFDVNVFGTLEVTRAFLPMIRRARGRVVNISSGVGRVSPPLMGGYAMTKFALEAMSDSLRVELRRAGVGVSVIEPGFVETPLMGKGDLQIEQQRDALPAEAPDYLRTSMQKLHEQIRGSKGMAPEAVARVVHRALKARRPRARYEVGADAKLLLTLSRVLPTRLLDSLMGGLVDL